LPPPSPRGGYKDRECDYDLDRNRDLDWDFKDAVYGGSSSNRDYYDQDTEF